MRFSALHYTCVFCVSKAQSRWLRLITEEGRGGEREENARIAVMPPISVRAEGCSPSVGHIFPAAPRSSKSAVTLNIRVSTPSGARCVARSMKARTRLILVPVTPLSSLLSCPLPPTLERTKGDNGSLKTPQNVFPRMGVHGGQLVMEDTKPSNCCPPPSINTTPRETVLIQCIKKKLSVSVIFHTA